MNPILAQKLITIAQTVRDAHHGDKGVIYTAACQELGLSYATLLRKLKKISYQLPRKQRHDAGKSAFKREEALLLSALLIDSMRKNGKRLYAIGDAVDVLRANGLIRAESIHALTGEVRALSISAITRALRQYGLHPEQLLAPPPAIELASLHPNHVWQVDASLCVLYYLNAPRKSSHAGLQVMDHTQFYKNKPHNLERIANHRVWSYEITDHASGWLYTEYVSGGESGENLCTVLNNAMQERIGADIMHGVPRILMLDAGSANTSAMTRNLCQALGINVHIHAVGNPRAIGQVENARNLIERKFEPGLKFAPVNNLAELNALAKKWRTHFNATAIHHRHGKTRSQMWITIRPEQLIKAPPLETCRMLAIAHPESRKVSSKLRVSFSGKEYDVSTVPNVMVGEKLLLTHNPWSQDKAQVVQVDNEGHRIFHIVNQVHKNHFGFSTTAATIGENFQHPVETITQSARKEIVHKLKTSGLTNPQWRISKKQTGLFNQQAIDPYQHLDSKSIPIYLPRHGVNHTLTPTLIVPPLSHIDAAKQIKDKLSMKGHQWHKEYFGWLAKNFPEGVPVEQLDTIEASLISLQMVSLTTTHRIFSSVSEGVAA